LRKKRDEARNIALIGDMEFLSFFITWIRGQKMRYYVGSGSWQGFGNVAQPTLMDKLVLPHRFFDLSAMVNQLRFMKPK
jgi:hypothetical protein